MPNTSRKPVYSIMSTSSWHPYWNMYGAAVMVIVIFYCIYIVVVHDPYEGKTYPREEMYLDQLPVEFVKRKQGEFTQRRQLMESFCNGSEPNYNKVAPHVWKSIKVDQDHKVLYCLPSKAGITNWKKMLLNISLNGHFYGYTFGNVHSFGRVSNRGIHNSDHYTMTERITFLDTYKKVISVREPLTRLLSAFRDKFLETKDLIVCHYLGRKILAKYRPNAGYMEKLTGCGITFEELVRYVVNSDESEYEPHFMPFAWKCDPCNIRYDYVTKTESLQEDVRYLAQEIFDQHPSAEIPGAYQHASTKSILLENYGDIPRELINGLYEFYSTEYKMFGYDKTLLDQL